MSESTYSTTGSILSPSPSDFNANVGWTLVRPLETFGRAKVRPTGIYLRMTTKPGTLITKPPKAHQTAPDLAIIIVSWNVRNMLAACLRTVEADIADNDLSVDIWLVDNNSTDDTVAMVQADFPQVKVIASSENLGFAGGNNVALRAIGFDRPEIAQENLPAAVLLLNPDTELHPDALQTLVEFLRANPQAGIAGAQLVYGDGSFQHGAFDFPGLWQLAIDLLPLPGRLVESRLNGRYPRSQYEAGQPFRIGHPLGAAMCVRREAIQQVGLLDDQYHMYVEEVDWSRRIVGAKWEAYCVPTAKVTHYGGASTGQIKTDSSVNLWRSRYRFYRTYYPLWKRKLAAGIVQLGLNRRLRQNQLALQQGQLRLTEYQAWQQAYQQIIEIWQGKK